jgi:DNA-directed RNA polymerase specialized sigma24 family protein
VAEVVMLRFYTGLSFEETAGVVGTSVSTVKRQWRFASAWLARELGGVPPGSDPPADAGTSDD